MIQGRCPICSKRFAVAALTDLPSFPFCSDRCRLLDLGRWIDGDYAIPAQATPETPDISSPPSQQDIDSEES